MSSPFGGNNDIDEEELRKRWLRRYLKAQGPVDTKLRKILVQASEDAESQIASLAKSPTFSAKVKTTQLKMVMAEIRSVLNDAFLSITPVVSQGNKDAAAQAADALTETDVEYIKKAFAASGGDYRDFIEGQRRQAQLQVANVVSKMYGFDKPLSSRVYRTRYQANTWVRNTVSRQIAIGASAKDIAKAVRSSIRTNTPGGVGYAAMRLGRTELNNAFHATSVNLAKDRPWINGMTWHTSKVHEPNDNGTVEICDYYNGQNFSLDLVPPKPHPHCRCFVVPEVEPLDTFVTHLTSGQYRDWIGNAA
jgi:cell pole-organizing protein PopZ